MTDVAPDYNPQHGEHTRDVRTIWAFSVAGVIAAGLLAYAIPASYESLSRLAAANAVPLAAYAPAGLDGGLVGLIVIDLALTWARLPIRVLHMLARLFGLASVAANAWAGWPDPVAVFLRVFAPALIVILSEVVRTALLRELRDERGEGDPIPLKRWLLAFPSTWVLYRRMSLWDVTDYHAAVDMELSRQQAVHQLTEHYRGRDWRQAAPPHLVWMLQRGVRMAEAIRLVGELTAPAGSHPSPVTPARKSPAKRSGSRSRARVTGDVTVEAAAWTILEASPGISGGKLAAELGVSKSYACRLKNRLLAGAPSTGPMPAVRQ